MSPPVGVIKNCLETKTLPEGVSAILVEARKTLSFGSNPVIILYGKVYLRKGILDGTEISTSKIVEELPGNIVRTRNSTYLVQYAKLSKDELYDRKMELLQDSAGE